METRGQRITIQIKPSPTIHYNLLHGSSGWSGLLGQDIMGISTVDMWIDVHVYGLKVMQSFLHKEVLLRPWNAASLYSGGNNGHTCTFNSTHTSIHYYVHAHTHTHSKRHNISRHILMTKACRCNLKHNTFKNVYTSCIPSAHAYTWLWSSNVKFLKESQLPLD